MNNIDIANESLKTILKKGDLYDVIALKEGVSLPKNVILKNHILLLSRILYGGVLAHEKIKSLLAPINRVRNAQEQIRNILGVNVDIVRSKSIFDDDSTKLVTKPFLSILYENPNINTKGYVEDLKKILSFCELHDIGNILLKESDVTYGFADINVGELKKKKLSTVLNYSINSTEDIGYELFSLTQSDLLNLIKELEVIKIDKKFILELSSDIEDITVRNAVSTFLSNGDLEKLKSIVNQRLTLNINSDSSYRDRVHGKIFENANIKDEFIKIMSSNNKGEIINNTVSTLYDYLGVSDFKSLLNQAKMPNDNKELLLISALYLYLCDNTKVKENTKSKSVNISFYDKIFNAFKAKQNGEIKQIPGLYTKSYKNSSEMASMIVTYLLTFLLLAIPAITGISLDFIQKIAFKNPNSTIMQNIFDGMFLPYRYSWDIENEMIERLAGTLGDIDFNIKNPNTSRTGDSKNNSKKVIGRMCILRDSDSYPVYFAEGFANKATYNKGQLNFNLIRNLINSNRFEDIEDVFAIIKPISKKDLKEAINNNEMAFMQSLYPVGDNYVLTGLQIIDREDENKVFSVNRYRVSISGNKITDYEAEMLKSMKRPEICYRYGISCDRENSFAERLDKYNLFYNSLSSEDVRIAITTGLGLEADATIEEIFKAIQSKKYSKNPIKDAGLTRKIKKMDEKEYYECVASLDSLICNMAASLAVGVDQEMIYTVGYRDNGDGYIIGKEAHAWAMNTEGEIIDITPLDNSEDDKDNALLEAISNVINWGMESNIPLYALITLVGAISYKLFGKKVKQMIKINSVEKILTNPNIDVSYAKIKETLYGGTNIPCKRTPIELVEALNKELNGLSIEELKATKRELLLSDLKNDRKLLNVTMKLVDEIPFIGENEASLIRAMHKKKQ